MGSSASLWAAAALAAAGLAGCGDREAAPTGSPAEREAVEAGYTAPPEVERVATVGPNLVVEGTAPPDARVRLEEAGGGAHGATADGRGRWRIEAPARGQPRLFALSAEAGERTLEAEGRLLVAPAAPALLLRPGHGALVVQPQTAASPRIVSVDVGLDGAAAVSGVGPPSAAAGTRVDGAQPEEAATVGSGVIDAQGRFSIILARPLPPGLHVVEVGTAAGVAAAQVMVTAVGPAAAPFAAQRDANGWRVSWRLPGGGVQTTHVFR